MYPPAVGQFASLTSGELSRSPAPLDDSCLRKGKEQSYINIS